MEELKKRIDPADLNLTDKLVYINRVSKVLKGGKRMSFSALVVTGDSAGHVGIGIGKSNEVPTAIAKGGAAARKNLIEVKLAGTTIPHEIRVKYGASRVMLKPAAPSKGIIAGGAIRAVLEAAGVKDIITKSLGSSNKTNCARATLLALTQLRNPKEEVARRKGTGAKEAVRAS